MSKAVYLVFGLITIVIGGLLTFIFSAMLMLAFEVEAEYPGPDIAPGFYFGCTFG